jgi:hypothetical protein
MIVMADKLDELNMLGNKLKVCRGDGASYDAEELPTEGESISALYRGCRIVIGVRGARAMVTIESPEYRNSLTLSFSGDQTPTWGSILFRVLQAINHQLLMIAAQQVVHFKSIGEYHVN